MRSRRTERADDNPFELLRQAAVRTPVAAASVTVRMLYVSAGMIAPVALVAGTFAHAQGHVRVSRIMACLILLSALAVVCAALIDSAPLLQELRDIQSHFLKHLSRCYTGELDVIQRLTERFTLHRLQDTEARLNLTIAQCRRKMPLALPFGKLATPAAVAVTYLIAPKLSGPDQVAQSWPTWLFVMLLVLSCLAVHHHLSMDALERSAMLLQRAIARKQEQKGDPPSTSP
jgi:hypothetical protein